MDRGSEFPAQFALSLAQHAEGLNFSGERRTDVKNRWFQGRFCIPMIRGTPHSNPRVQVAWTSENCPPVCSLGTSNRQPKGLFPPLDGSDAFAHIPSNFFPATENAGLDSVKQRRILHICDAHLTPIQMRRTPCVFHGTKASASPFSACPFQLRSIHRCANNLPDNTLGRPGARRYIGGVHPHLFPYNRRTGLCRGSNTRNKAPVGTVRQGVP
jgi:hypothetical protein